MPEILFDLPLRSADDCRDAIEYIELIAELLEDIKKQLDYGPYVSKVVVTDDISRCSIQYSAVPDADHVSGATPFGKTIAIDENDHVILIKHEPVELCLRERQGIKTPFEAEAFLRNLLAHECTHAINDHLMTGGSTELAEQTWILFDEYCAYRNAYSIHPWQPSGGDKASIEAFEAELRSKYLQYDYNNRLQCRTKAMEFLMQEIARPPFSEEQERAATTGIGKCAQDLRTLFSKQFNTVLEDQAPTLDEPIVRLRKFYEGMLSISPSGER